MRISAISRYRGAYFGRYVLRGRHPAVYVADVMRAIRSGQSQRDVMRRHEISRAELAVIVMPSNVAIPARLIVELVAEPPEATATAENSVVPSISCSA